VAVCMGSDVGKDMAGEPLLRGVSFKVERRDRLTLSGRNGSGKTTLLRMIAGETGVDSGELSFAKGTRVALHDQRPPRERNVTLRDYVLGGCGDLVGLEAELARLEHAMADGDTSQKTLDAYARAQARLEHAGGYNRRERALGVLQGAVARVAQGTGGARARAGPRDRASAGRDRAARALRHPLPRRHACASGAGAREEARSDRADRARAVRRPLARVQLRQG